MKIKLHILLLILLGLEAVAITPIDLSIRLTAEIDSSSGLNVILSWIPDSTAKEYYVQRKIVGETKWKSLANDLDSTTLSYEDENVQKGVAYEYLVQKKMIAWVDTTTEIFDGYGYICVGKDFYTKDYNGRLLLLIDNTLKDSLALELNRFIYDITADGWTVIPKLVPRTEEFNPDAVLEIKNIIVNEFISHPDSLSGLILFGRIAVPYSGKHAIDGHINHQGAWPSDVFYSDIYGEYLDETVDDTSSDWKRIWNVPGDGKFDRNQIDKKSLLQMGRIDFYNITHYGISEIELYRNYLTKNYQYRNMELIPDFIGLIDGNFGMPPEPFEAGAWSDFAALLGIENVERGDFQRPRESSPVLWSFGCGAGSFWGIENTVSLWDLDTVNSGGIFSALLGSYNGDWDNQDNILRSQLAYSQYGLTVSWSGRPFWHYHLMSLGFPVGHCARLSQNNQVEYESNTKYGHRFMHIALLGDPTLKMYYEPKVENLQISSIITYNSSQVILSWESLDSAIGYNVYRTNALNEKLIKLNDDLLQDSEFIDNMPRNGTNIYKVSYIKNRSTTAGNIFHPSKGAIIQTEIPKINYSSGLEFNFSIYPNPAENYTKLSYTIEEHTDVEITIWDELGRLVKQIELKNQHAGHYIKYWNLRNSENEIIHSGNYYIVLKCNSKEEMRTLQVIK